MRSIKPKKVLFLIILMLAVSVSNAQVPIFVSEKATETEQLAAEQLQYYLSQIYPSEKFAISKGNSQKPVSRSIRIGTIKSQPELKKYLTDKSLQGPESYVVTNSVIDGKQTGIVLGADDAGVMYGVYGLLEKLGCGFYLSTETLPAPRNEPFDFTPWNLADHPLVDNRIVFNWHNFLSGCTGWDYKHWEQWIIQSQKMGYNTIMVHAYGNNPMFTFTFNGMNKPVGYVGTTKRGRDWGNQHINNVRRLPGGDIFPTAEFGSEAALVPNDKRIEAKQAMMKKVFSLAQHCGMKICFALDVDTSSMIPQNMILTLPEEDRFHNGKLWLPRPDTKGGYEFYKTQVRALFKLYPQIDTLALWRRTNAVEWGRLKKAKQLPEQWQQEYNLHIQQNPDAGKMYQGVCAFALNKVVGAFRKALNEIGKPEVKIAMGSWRHSWVPSLVEFLPEEVTIIPLDADCMPRYRSGSFLNIPEKYESIATAKGRIVPIIWAHHDDGEYIGRPLHCHENFNDTLSKLQSRGFGVIHWMNRPLDLYFENHSNQVWSNTKNEYYKQTCMSMAQHYFGNQQEQSLGNYLYRWATDAPIFGRVTRDHFFVNGPQGDENIPNYEQMMQKCRERIELLSKADSSKMTPTQKQRVDYFIKLENMLISFCKVQELAYRPGRNAIEAGDFSKARTLLKSEDPKDTIRQFSRLSQIAGKDRTEEAMVISLGTRWLTDYLAACQAAGCETIRINYGPTHFEPLAQSPGKYTFHIDEQGRYWSVRGQRETHKPAIEYNADIDVSISGDVSGAVREITRTGIVIDAPTTLSISPIVDLHKKIAPGDYRLVIYAGSASGQKQVKVRFNTKPVPQSNVQDKTYVLKNSHKSNVTVQVIEKQIHLAEPVVLPQLYITPEEGTVVLYGLTLKMTSAE